MSNSSNSKISQALADYIADIPYIGESGRANEPITIDDLSPELREAIERGGQGGGGGSTTINLGVPDFNLKNEVAPSAAKSGVVPIIRTVEVSVNNAMAKHAAFFKVIDDVVSGNNVFLVGEAGTGKTYLAERVSNALKREYVTLNCNQWTPPREILGGETISGYKDGKLADAWEFGKILILDELPKLDPNTAGILNEALAKSDKVGADSKLTLPNGRVIEKHPNFGCIATGNTTGKTVSSRYGGNNRQDGSLIDRFSSCYYFIQFDRNLEINNIFTPVFTICDQIRTVLLAEEADEIMTLRTMLQMNRIFHLEMQRTLGNVENVEGGKTLKDSIESYMATMDEDMRQVVEEKVDFRMFSHTYKDMATYKNDLKEFQNGTKRIPPQ